MNSKNTKTRQPPVTKARLKYLVRLSVAALFLLFIFSKVPLQSVLDVMSGTNLAWASLSFALLVSSQLFLAIRMKLLAAWQGMSFSVMETLQFNLVARFYGLFLPGGNLSGTVVRAFQMGKKDSNYTGSGAAIFLDRVFATQTLLLLGIAFWLCQSQHPSTIWLLALLVSLLGVSGLAFLITHQKVLAKLEGFYAINVVTRVIGSLHRALSNYHNITVDLVIKSTGLSLLAHLIGVVSFWSAAIALGISLDFTATGWARSLILFLTLIPVSLAGIGFREAGAYFALTQYHIDPAIIISYSLLIFCVNVLGLGALGGIFEVYRVLRADNPCEL